MGKKMDLSGPKRRHYSWWGSQGPRSQHSKTSQCHPIDHWETRCCNSSSIPPYAALSWRTGKQMPWLQTQLTWEQRAFCTYTKNITDKPGMLKSGSVWTLFLTVLQMSTCTARSGQGLVRWGGHWGQEEHQHPAGNSDWTPLGWKPLQECIISKLSADSKSIRQRTELPFLFLSLRSKAHHKKN